MSRLRIEKETKREPFDTTIIIVLAFAICSAMEFLNYSYNFSFGTGFVRIKNLIPFAVATLYGIVPGIACLVPMTVAQIVWVAVISKAGTDLSPFLNLLAIIVAVIFVGFFASRPKIKTNRWYKASVFEVGIVFAYALMTIIHAIAGFASVNVLFLFASGANIIVLGCLLLLTLIKEE